MLLRQQYIVLVTSSWDLQYPFQISHISFLSEYRACDVCTVDWVASCWDAKNKNQKKRNRCCAIDWAKIQKEFRLKFLPTAEGALIRTPVLTLWRAWCFCPLISTTEEIERMPANPLARSHMTLWSHGKRYLCVVGLKSLLQRSSVREEAALWNAKVASEK